MFETVNRFCSQYGYVTLSQPTRSHGDRITPEHIRSLKPNEVFVFGSNLAGAHGGGAARAALNYFGAVWGQGVGRQGQSYAIPTMQGGVETIKPFVDDFIEYATDEEIAPLFRAAVNIENICLSSIWWSLLNDIGKR